MRLPGFDGRRAGVLLPMSALEAALGRGGRALSDWLAEAGFSVWQILPAGPVGEDRSPYWVRSDCAGNPAFLDPAELPDPAGPVDPEFLAASASWLRDYALFEALTGAHGGAPFWEWPPPLRDREPEALARAAAELSAEVARLEREQYGFYVQWNRLRAYALSRGVRLLGDLPFYVGPSSLETWAHRELFQLKPSGEPAAVGGVPPDYFSPVGQLWGNPVYDWQALKRTGFAWWLARVRAQLARMDLLRIDHFRALAAYWGVPAGAPDPAGDGGGDARGADPRRSRLRGAPGGHSGAGPARARLGGAPQHAGDRGGELDLAAAARCADDRARASLSPPERRLRARAGTSAGMSAGMSTGMRGLAGLAAAVLLGSCALTPRFTPPKLSIADVQLAGGDLWEQRLRVRLHVENPNSRPLPVKELEYTLEVAGQQLARGASAASFIVPAMGESEFDTNVTTNLAGTLLTLLGRSEER